MTPVLRMSCLVLILGGCGLWGGRSAPAPPEDPVASTPPETEATETAPEPAPVRLPATTIASLGNVREPGLWMRTPLVSAPTPGMISDPATGRSVAVDLIPVEGAPGAGSRLSLAAYQALGLPLTALPELRVAAR